MTATLDGHRRLIAVCCWIFKLRYGGMNRKEEWFQYLEDGTVGNSFSLYTVFQ